MGVSHMPIRVSVAIQLQSVTPVKTSSTRMRRVVNAADMTKPIRKASRMPDKSMRYPKRVFQRNWAHAIAQTAMSSGSSVYTSFSLASVLRLVLASASSAAVRATCSASSWVSSRPEPSSSRASKRSKKGWTSLSDTIPSCKSIPSANSDLSKAPFLSVSRAFTSSGSNCLARRSSRSLTARAISTQLEAMPIKLPKRQTLTSMCTIANARADCVVGPMSPSPTVLAVIIQW
mmetsp:Transcript_16/g.60  ORF Transcript_16/g.60 Transcript_16/m.60 type:complete len:232 (-) Transcript_16:1081-1776(-)